MSIWMNSKIFSISLIILSILLPTAYGDDVTYLDKGTPAPYDGFLLTVPKAKEYRLITIERDNYKLVNESLNNTILSLQNINKYEEEKNGILLKQNDNLAQTAYNSQRMSDLEKVLWFGGGVIATILVLYGVQHLAH